MFLQTHIWHPSAAWRDMFYPTNVASSQYPQYTITGDAYSQRKRIARCHPDTAAVMRFASPTLLPEPEVPTAEAQHATVERCAGNNSCSSGRNYSCKDHIKLIGNFIVPYSIFFTFAWKLTCSTTIFFLNSFFIFFSPQLIQSQSF